MTSRLVRPRRFAVLSTGLVAALLATPATGASQTVGYAIEPGADYVRWDDDLGIDEGWMWGGALTFELGPRVRLSPFYLKGTEFESDPATIDGLPDAEAFNFDARHVGASLDIDLSTGGVTPFLRAGGGILRIDPEGRDAIDRVALTYGGGLRFGVGRAGVRLFAEATSYRLSLERLYATGQPEGEEPARRNLVAGARVSIPLSEMPADPGVGLSGASVPVGVFAGEFDFDDESGLPNQRIAGVRAGIAFNPLVSLQGFYWRGVNDDFDALQEVRGYGAEGRFDLGSGTGLSPFVVAGGARLDYPETGADADEDDPFTGRDDQTALILGAGIDLRLTDRLDLELSARDYLLEPAGDIEGVSDPGELTSNWLFSAGVELDIGGSSVDRDPADRTADAQAERRRLQRELDSLEAEVTASRSGVRIDRSDSTATRMRAGGDTVSTPRMRRVLRAPGGQVITLPVLEEGAIYIRFGPDGADTGLRIDRSELRRLIREEWRDAAPTADSSATPADLDDLERRLLDRLEQRGLFDDPATRPETGGTPSAAVMDRLNAIEQELLRRAGTDEAARVGEAREDETPAPAETAWDRMGRFETRRTLPFGGLAFAGSDQQVALGARFDFGPLSEGSRLDLVPEASFAFGGGESALTAMANLQYQFADLGTRRDIEPYLIAGAGFYSPTFLGVSTGLGVEFDLRNADRGDPLRSYLEVQGMNLFDDTRLLFGVSLRR